MKIPLELIVVGTTEAPGREDVLVAVEVVRVPVPARRRPVRARFLARENAARGRAQNSELIDQERRDALLPAGAPEQRRHFLSLSGDRLRIDL